MKSVLKRIVKALANALSLVCAFPMAALSSFGRWEAPFTLFAQTCALVPGLPGDYLRIAYYRLTLEECALSGRVSFGTLFAHPQARIGPGVYLGSYCILGCVRIGERTQIASGVQILSGRHQHPRDQAGRISGSAEFTTVTIGADCWIGAAAVVMADVGAGSTIGAGSVVSAPIPPRSVAVGVPARVVKSAVESGTTLG